jgi:hypothetical protein
VCGGGFIRPYGPDRSSGHAPSRCLFTAISVSRPDTLPGATGEECAIAGIAELQDDLDMAMSG